MRTISALATHGPYSYLQTNIERGREGEIVVVSGSVDKMPRIIDFYL